MKEQVGMLINAQIERLLPQDLMFSRLLESFLLIGKPYNYINAIYSIKVIALCYEVSHFLKIPSN